jgi:hypothetical protein
MTDDTFYKPGSQPAAAGDPIDNPRLPNSVEDEHT